MTKFIRRVLPFPVDAQSNPFFCALSSVFLSLGPYDQDTPFFCGRKQAYCANCGECGDKTNPAKHHLGLYHHFLTVTGVGLMWKDDAACDAYDRVYRPDVLPPGLDDRLDFAMRAAGYNTFSMHRETGRQGIFERIARSIDRGTPALIKLGDAQDWCVVTGYDDADGSLYGLDASRHYACRPAVQPDGYTEDGLFCSTGWYEHLAKAVVLNGESGAALGLRDLLARMIAQLSSPQLSTLEAQALRAIDGADAESAQASAEYLNDLAGYAVEARWHAAECAASTLAAMTQDEQCRDLLYRCTATYLNTHDECWKIWGVLGVGPQTGYRVPPHAGDMLRDKANQAELKRLFAIVFNNDRKVLDCLRRCAHRLS